MSSRKSDGFEPFVAPLYLLAFLLVATPLMDFVTSVMPFRFGNIEWRFATVGLLSGFLLTPLLGVALFSVVSSYAGHDKAQRVVAVLNIAVALAFVGMLALFLLDVLQLRNAVQAEGKAQFMAAAMKAFLKHVCFVFALLWFVLRAFKASRWTAPVERRGGGAVVIGT